MDCPNCGARHGDTAHFCTQCGIPLDTNMQIASMLTSQRVIQREQKTDWTGMIISAVGFLSNLMLQIAMVTFRLIIDIVESIF